MDMDQIIGAVDEVPGEDEYTLQQMADDEDSVKIIIDKKN
jgi:hypothetical protein